MVSRKDFEYPTGKTYLAGMSLGCASLQSLKLIEEELQVWREQGVEGHSQQHIYNRSWFGDMERLCNEKLAELILGADPSEVAVMGELSANLNMLLLQFYRPTNTRFKIVMEDKPFPSDLFLVQGHLQRFGYDPQNALALVKPRESGVIEEDDFCALIDADPSICLILLGGVNYLTGQVFDMARLAKHASEKSVLFGVDLAHAVGNVPLELSKWGVDFAAWCSYKYLNAGPGAIAGVYVHKRHHTLDPVFKGWWGTKDRFGSEYKPIESALRFTMSNPNVLSMASLLGSLQTFEQARSMKDIRDQSFELTELFREKTAELQRQGIMEIITPREKERSGAQLTLRFSRMQAEHVYEKLRSAGIIVDTRSNCIRIAFVALYNTVDDVVLISNKLNDILTDLQG
mgnify:CR=1 FL=1